MMLKDFKNKIALITGSAVRIGREIATSLAREGAGVVLHYRNSEKEATDTLKEIQSFGVKAWTIQADFNLPEATESLIQKTLSLTGSLDFLINNASEFFIDTMEDMNWATLEKNIRINAWVPFSLTRQFARLVKKGSIVNLIDARIKGKDWRHVSYISSKHLLSAFTQMTALYYSPDIQVNAVNPGLILQPKGKQNEFLDALTGIVPLKRHGSPQDIASAVLYLLKNDFLTGTVIDVDGGYHLEDLSHDLGKKTTPPPFLTAS